jgi:phosphocarrier protein HPr
MSENTRTIKVVNSLGVHARPSALLVQLANEYEAELFVCRKGDEDSEVNAKSIMGVMMLAAGEGTLLRFRAKGDDGDVLLDAIESLFNAKFNEE